jgi:hypothetical protein
MASADGDLTAAGVTVRSIACPNNDTAKKELIGMNLDDCWYS